MAIKAKDVLRFRRETGCSLEEAHRTLMKNELIKRVKTAEIHELRQILIEVIRII